MNQHPVKKRGTPSSQGQGDHLEEKVGESAECRVWREARAGGNLNLGNYTDELGERGQTDRDWKVEPLRVKPCCGQVEHSWMCWWGLCGTGAQAAEKVVYGPGRGKRNAECKVRSLRGFDPGKRRILSAWMALCLINEMQEHMYSNLKGTWFEDVRSQV